MLLEYILYLPDEIVTIIWSYVCNENKIFINKEYYLKYNYLIDNIIDYGSYGRYESYIRDIIRLDFIFVFTQILERKYTFFLRIRNYKYNNVIYSNFLMFLLYFCNKNNAQKCSNLINLQLSLSGLKKERRKNNRLKYNKWSN